KLSQDGKGLSEKNTFCQ
ncbi:hypothetical protein CISIN_1g0424792mg, partial [Citrus sinensis]